MDNVIDKLILEWSWRCEKGYPDINDDADKKILINLLEKYGVSLNLITDKLNEATSNTEVFQKKVNSLKLSEVDSVIKVFNSLTNEQQTAIVEEIQKNHTIQSFKNNIDSLSKTFAPFFNIQVSGAGRGELLPLLSIAGSKSGGTAEKDVIVGKEIMEVKELDATGKFRTGKTGSIRDSQLDENVQTLIKIIKNLPDSITEIKDIKEKILDYYNNTYKYGSGKPGFFLKDLPELIKKFPKDTSKLTDKDTEDYVKLNGKKYFYTMSDTDTIKVGSEVDAGIESIIKIKRHPYFKDISKVEKDLEKLKESYLNSINYLLLYSKGKPFNPVLLDREEALSSTFVYDVNQQAARIKYGKRSTEQEIDEEVEEE